MINFQITHLTFKFYVFFTLILHNLEVSLIPNYIIRKLF